MLILFEMLMSCNCILELLHPGVAQTTQAQGADLGMFPSN